MGQMRRGAPAELMPAEAKLFTIGQRLGRRSRGRSLVNLRFLIAAGLLADRDHRIAGLAAAGQVPVIATPVPEPRDGQRERPPTITEKRQRFPSS